MPDGFHLAQVNIAAAKAPMDSQLMAGFAAGLAPVNALADGSPGFVWRLQTEDGDATAIRPYEDERVMVNMSLWESLDELRRFVYRSGHVEYMRRRREWFERMRLYMALWWVPVGHTPTVEEAKDRLANLEHYGPTPYAFTFKASFPTTAASSAVIDDEIGCPA